MPNIQFQFRRGLASQWTSVNPVLAEGEMGIETDTDLFKIGDGVTNWNSLPYGGLQGVQGAPGVQGSVGAQGDVGVQGFQGAQGVQGDFGAQGAQGVQGAQGDLGVQGSQGAQGFQGDAGIQGAQGSQGVQGDLGVQGAQGYQGLDGVQGAQGAQGVQGAQGREGNFGGASFYYRFLTKTDTNDPNPGNLNVNNSDMSLATVLSIDDLDRFGANISSFLQTIDDSTSGIKGTVKLAEEANTLNFVIYNIPSTHTEHQSHFDVPLAYVLGSATPYANSTNVIVSFLVTGDKGDIGAQGAQGTQGVQGAQGFQGDAGAQGAVGAQGDVGTQGVQGAQGFQGNVGAQGTIGAQGSVGAQGAVGAQGTVGAQGAVGVIGAQGAQGAQGAVGAQGAIGAQGNTGTGVQGAQGVQGAPGGGGGSAITVKDEGTNLTTALASIDFVGSGVQATTVGNDVTVTIGGGLASFPVSANTGATVTASGLNFTNTSTVTVVVESGLNGNANVSFTSSGAGAQGAQGAQGAPGSGGSPTTFSTKTANYTMTTSDEVIISTATTPITITLPSAADATKSYYFQNFGTSTMTLATVSSQLINDETTLILQFYGSSCRLISDGTKFLLF